ncbi:MAG: bifunctional UDP-N-acetylglucosamine diphosphorylase/glucosamine-1-phosphate N-acetyltransferase GlmU [Acidobacteriia bacterium]|nr:bifunctional UDP-N-acetylglucosamine diphosphorylase/glucosamine-1-phosphate N-acetyltransferase GlmU [Terriglobia bacterium]
MSNSLIAVVMAAGRSTRFKSQRSKLATPVHGKSMIERVVEATEGLSPQTLYVVVGHCAEEVQSVLRNHSLKFVTQQPQLGTGHCVLVATQQISESSGTVLILNGDIPLIGQNLLKKLLEAHRSERADATVVSTRLEDPSGYGRILKNRSGKIARIIEDRDATPAQRRIQEINVGMYLISLDLLKKFISKLSNQNAQQEYYLTDLVELLISAKKKVNVFETPDPLEVLGVNDRIELAAVDRVLRLRTLERLMRDGVTIMDPLTTTVEEGVSIGQDTILFPGVRIEGSTTIGQRCLIRSHCRITNSTLGDDVTVHDLSVINESHVAERATIGPFAHLRLDAVVESNARVGNFVELKKTKLGQNSKASHLTYLGDTTVGQNANIGAGTITCNYDGVNKNSTVIGDECFIGSGVELVAPVVVHKGAYVAAGSVITHDVPPDALAIARGRQENKRDWKQKRADKRSKSTKA